ncbi:MAG: hypothetical protein KDE56_21555 [Anaerolineales bacterium]|nr:hypothetical protein [Anaerolineales bacterium]
MTLQVTIPLSEKTYKRVQQWAALRQQDIGEAIADYLTDTLPNSDSLIVPPAEPDDEVEREKQAYIQLHPTLKQTHLGKYVAIYNGRLVDEDEAYSALFERIDALYPDSFVWMTQVKEKPIETLFVRSFRVETQ